MSKIKSMIMNNKYHIICQRENLKNQYLLIHYLGTLKTVRTRLKAI